MRLHYVYPYPHVDEVIPLMAEGKVLPYLDIPFQHASPRVLKRMRRPATQEKNLERIARWREICPELAIRSTFIVGFPGETEAEFEMLLDWLDEAKLDRVGCFRYEPVAGAAANELARARCPTRSRRSAGTASWQAQQEISDAQARGQGRQAHAGAGRRSAGRDRPRAARNADAPEIDGAVHIESRRPIRAGEIVTARIERSDAYDLHGQVV